MQILVHSMALHNVFVLEPHNNEMIRNIDKFFVSPEHLMMYMNLHLVRSFQIYRKKETTMNPPALQSHTPEHHLLAR